MFLFMATEKLLSSFDQLLEEDIEAQRQFCGQALWLKEIRRRYVHPIAAIAFATPAAASYWITLQTIHNVNGQRGYERGSPQDSPLLHSHGPHILAGLSSYEHLRPPVIGSNVRPPGNEKASTKWFVQLAGLSTSPSSIFNTLMGMGMLSLCRDNEIAIHDVSGHRERRLSAMTTPLKNHHPPQSPKNRIIIYLPSSNLWAAGL
jgi:hypothetical protein